MRRFLLLALFLAAACHHEPLNKAAQVDLAKADALVWQGCYDCLLDARGIYERLSVGRARPLVIEQLFEVNLLLGLRERELALDSAASFDRARANARELPPGAEADRIITFADAIRPDNIGTPFSVQEAFRRAHAAFAPKIDDEIAWLKTTVLREPVRQYLALSMDCINENRPRPRQAPPRPSEEPLAPDAPPLVLLRAAICAQDMLPILARVRAAEPRFVEAAFFQARPLAAKAQEDGGVKAKAYIAEAIARFPKSPSITYLDGQVLQLAGNCKAALPLFDTTIDLQPAHENAWLGRTICRTLTKQFDPAIESATHMIDAKMTHLSEAYYWRAWIRHYQKELVPARADIEESKKLATSVNTATLAGIIEYEQNDLVPAETDLKIGRRSLDGYRNCTAMWYLGLVTMKTERWKESGQQFADAMACYQMDVGEAEEAIKKLNSTPDLDPDFKTTQIANFEQVIKESSSQQYAAAFNAANFYARGGEIPKARVYLEIAAKDPALAAPVATLRALLKGSGLFSTALRRSETQGCGKKPRPLMAQ